MLIVIYQWVEKRGKRINYSKAYKDWLLGRRTLAEICNDLDVSYPKLNKEFDKFDISEGLQDRSLKDINKPIELVGVKSICQGIQIPKVAIGGINASNIKNIILAGSDGAAVISAILGQKDIRAAAEKLQFLIKS